MNLIKVAKILYSYQRSTNWDELYQTIMKGSFFKDFKDILSASDIVKVVYLAQEIGNKGEPEKLLKKLDGLYVFSILDFEDNVQYVECHQCYGNGVTECDYCNGYGEVDCQNCDGVGEVDNEICDDCNGSGLVDCDYCRGGNVNCDVCGGSGEIEETDYVPFLNSQYVSYNRQLLNSLELKEMNTEEVNTVLNKYNDDIHFIDSQNESVHDDAALNVNSEFQHTVHVNGITSLYYLNKTTNGTLSNSDLYNIDEKFYN